VRVNRVVEKRFSQADGEERAGAWSGPFPGHTLPAGAKDWNAWAAAGAPAVVSNTACQKARSADPPATAGRNQAD